MARKDIIRADSVVKILGNSVIIYDATLDVKDGEIFGLIGPSGSGKTTLLRILIGFFKAEKGDVLVRSSFLKDRSHELYTSVMKDDEAVKSVFGFASQDPSIYMNLTAEENLRYFGALQGLEAEDIEKTMDILLTLMDLQPARKTLGKNLSGGMQRRLDIACAMIHKPKLLILDEPTADLDPFLRRHIWDMIRKINERGTTVIVSSHELADVERICDRVAVVHHGKILEVDTPEKIKKKFINVEQIRLQTFPGKYKKLRRLLDDDDITEIDEEGQQLIITTREAEKTLPKIIEALQEAKESLTSIRVEASSLDKVFLQLAEEDE